METGPSDVWKQSQLHLSSSVENCKSRGDGDITELSEKKARRFWYLFQNTNTGSQIGFYDNGEELRHYCDLNSLLST